MLESVWLGLNDEDRGTRDFVNLAIADRLGRGEAVFQGITAWLQAEGPPDLFVNAARYLDEVSQEAPEPADPAREQPAEDRPASPRRVQPRLKA